MSVVAVLLKKKDNFTGTRQREGLVQRFRRGGQAALSDPHDSRHGSSSIAISSFWETETFFFFSSRRRHTRVQGDWSSDVCSSDLGATDNPIEYEGTYELPEAQLDRFLM